MNETTFPMVAVPAGVISLKDERKNLFWTVQLRPFSIGKFSVTQEEYFSITEDKEACEANKTKPIVEVSWLDSIQFCNLLSRKKGLGECYSFDQLGAVDCNWNADGYRLPSEAEWEYACRAGSNDKRYGNLDEIAWHRGNSDHYLHDVGTKAPNAWGIYDMIGNSWDWCWDIFDAQMYGSYRVFRGGGWADQPSACRASCRRKSHPTYRVDDLGFRLARSL
jgi:formylglycine-generating enzyme required for sulfatase activity